MVGPSSWLRWGMAVRVVRFDDPEVFARRAEPFLMAREAEHNLLLGLLGAIREGDERYSDPYMALVVEGDRVVAVALRTSIHHNALLSCVERPEAVEVVAGDLAEVYATLTGVMADKGSARRFSEAWREISGQGSRLHMRQRIHRARTAWVPEDVPGRMRPASASDRELLVGWMAAFTREVGEDGDLEEAAAAVDRWLASPSGRLFVWEDDGAVVSLAGSGGPTPNGMRIGPVYTPPEIRGRGYATALVGAVTKRRLDEGRRFCFLFTDLANPTSNAIYARIGYEPVLDVDQYRFEGVPVETLS